MGPRDILAPFLLSSVFTHYCTCPFYPTTGRRCFPHQRGNSGAPGPALIHLSIPQELGTEQVRCICKCSPERVSHSTITANLKDESPTSRVQKPSGQRLASSFTIHLTLSKALKLPSLNFPV